MFLVWCDQSGKTSIHSVACPQIGAKYPDCNCPKRLAYDTVKSRIPQLKSIFDSVGRSDPCGNPASSNEVQVYLKQIRVEQSVGHVQPQQAKPIFMKKLLIAMYIDRQLNGKPLLLINRFILTRDQALFKFFVFGGDRGNDAGLMLIQEISRLPQDAGLIIRHTFGKTLLVDKPNISHCFDVLTKLYAQSKDLNYTFKNLGNWVSPRRMDICSDPPSKTRYLNLRFLMKPFIRDLSFT